MPDAVPFALWAWVPISLVLFGRLGPPRGALACLLGGWLVLPTARFPDDLAGVLFPYWIMPACLPSDLWTTKARVIGVSALLGVMAFDPGAWRRSRPRAHDLAILGWCLCPLASAAMNRTGMLGAVADSGYLAMSWGVPYLLGRLYFADPGGMELLARGFVGAALAYVPICLIELVASPTVYVALYGTQPYRAVGMARYLGFRPIGLLEDGNQLGIWMAMAAVVAAWLWRSGRLGRFLGIPGWLVAAVLVGQAILSQSAGAVILLGLGLAGVEALARVDRTWPILVVGALALGLVGARALNLVDAKALANRTGLGRSLVEASTRLDRQSLGWRLRVEERAAKTALRRPLLGWGRWDWWRESPGGERPWGLFSLTLGMYGLLGWTLLIGVFGLPLSAFLNLGPPRFWTMPNRAPAAALAAALAISAVDAALNPCLFPPILAAAGALVGLKYHSEAAASWIRKAQSTIGGPSATPWGARR